MNAFSNLERLPPRTLEDRDNFGSDNQNLRVWLDNEWTNPKFTKPITGKTYSGKSPNVTYVFKRLTAAFGPIGWGWGYEIIRDQDIADPTGGVITNFITIRFFYYPLPNGRDPEKPEGYGRASFEQIGATTMAYTTRGKDGQPGRAIFDDDAKKKSISDAITKAASMIGICGDLFLGRHDDNKYLTDIAKEDAAARLEQSPFAFIDDAGETHRVMELADWIDAWRSVVRDRTSSNQLERLRSDWDRNRDAINVVKKLYRKAATSLEDAIRVALGLEVEPEQPPADNKDMLRAIAGRPEPEPAKPTLQDSMPGGSTSQAAEGGGAASAAKGLPYLDGQNKLQSAAKFGELRQGVEAALAHIGPDREGLYLYHQSMTPYLESMAKSPNKAVVAAGAAVATMIVDAREKVAVLSRANTGRLHPEE